MSGRSFGRTCLLSGPNPAAADPMGGGCVKMRLRAGPRPPLSEPRVNAILPGAVETGMYREMNDTADKQAFMTNLHALKRVAQPEELARSVLYQASDDSAFVTGTASLVDGGASITRS